jgi:hypothetical protein
MIKVTRVITADSFDGCPWPPISTDNWHAIRHINGFTVWRAIQIAQPEPPPADAQSTLGGNYNGN